MTAYAGNPSYARLDRAMWNFALPLMRLRQQRLGKGCHRIDGETKGADVPRLGLLQRDKPLIDHRKAEKQRQPLILDKPVQPRHIDRGQDDQRRANGDRGGADGVDLRGVKQRQHDADTIALGHARVDGGAERLDIDARWVPTTPFGAEVVPLV